MPSLLKLFFDERTTPATHLTGVLGGDEQNAGTGTRCLALTYLLELPLILNVLLHDRERRSPYHTHEVPIRPQRRDLALQPRKLLTYQPPSPPLHQSYH